MNRILLIVYVSLWACGIVLASGNGERTKALIQVLESSPSVQAKALACRELGEIGTKEAVPALAALLDDAVLNAYARAGLERNPDPSARVALRSAVATTTGKARAGVIQSLGALRDAGAVNILIPLAAKEETALLALGRIATDKSVAEVRQQLAEGAKGAEAACLLAAEGLLQQGKRQHAITVYDALTTARIPLPYRVAATRGAIMARQSVPFLLNKLKSSEPGIRDVAFLTIQSMVSDELADGLHKLLSNAAVRQRVRIIAALRTCHNAQTVSVLAEEMAHENAEIRLATIHALGDLGGERAVGALLAAFHRDVLTREEFAVIEDQLQAQPGNQTDSALIKALPSAESPMHRTVLIRLLGDRQAITAKPVLLQQANDPDLDIGEVALRAVRRLVGPEDIVALMPMVKRPGNPAYRKAAGDALATACASSNDGRPIIDALQDATDPAESLQWVRALTAMGYAPALQSIASKFERTADPDILDQLARWPSLDPLPLLFDVIETSDTTNAHNAALSAVLQLLANAPASSNEHLVPEFRRALKATSSQAHKRLLVSGLGNVHHPDGLQLLGGFLDDESVREEAALAFVQAAWPVAESGNGTALIEATLEKLPKIDDRGYRQKVAMLKAAVR